MEHLFIQLLDKTFFNSTKKGELIALFQQTVQNQSSSMDTKVKKIEHSIMDKKMEHTCTTILKSGKNKGKPCGKPCKDNYCSTHDTKVKATKPSNVTSKKLSTELCGMIIKHGKNKGTICKNALESCIVHPPLRVTKYKNYLIIKGTNVIFDEEEQCVIGYKHDAHIIMEENQEVKLVCKQYDLEYAKLFRKYIHNPNVHHK